jgi:hypothetical protein
VVEVAVIVQILFPATAEEYVAVTPPEKIAFAVFGIRRMTTPKFGPSPTLPDPPATAKFVEVYPHLLLQQPQGTLLQ